MTRLFWIIWAGPKCNHMYLYKGEEAGDYTDKKREASMKIETEIRVIWPKAMECQQT